MSDLHGHVAVLRRRREKLEVDLHKLITEFEAETDLVVKDFILRRADGATLGEKRPRLTLIGTYAEVEL